MNFVKPKKMKYLNRTSMIIKLVKRFLMKTTQNFHYFSHYLMTITKLITSFLYTNSCMRRSHYNM